MSTPYLKIISACLFVGSVVLGQTSGVQTPAEAGQRGEPTTPVVKTLQTRSRAAIIGPEDTITIVAPEAEEISKEWRVSASGDVSLPLLGRVHVGGMTVEDAERAIAERMVRYYVTPLVSVFISEYQSEPVTVIGAVEKPGTIQLKGHTTIFDALAQTGGPKPIAGELTLTRSVEEGSIPWPGAHSDGKVFVADLPLKEVMTGKGAAASILLKPFDILNVKEPRQQRVVTVSGEVLRPGVVELVTQDTVSIAKVIAMAGGISRVAAPSRTMIIHVNQEGVRTSSAYIDLKKVLSGQFKDIELSAGDIVVVPSSQFMTYVQAASMSALSTGMYLLGRL